MNFDASKISAAVIVLHWNKLNFTIPCYESLLRLNSCAKLRIIIVDNGSTAHLPDELKKRCPKAETVRLSENLGFAGGMNVGIRLALGTNPELIWLLNNDTVCAADAFEEIAHQFANDDGVGAVASRLIQAGSGEILSSTKRAAPPFYIPTRAGDNSKSGRDTFLCGASLCFRTATLRKVGLFDTDFPFFFEDADWSFRARAAGWRLSETPTASVTHTGSASIGTLGRKEAKCYRYGHLLFLRKHANLPIARALPPFLWRLLISVARFDFQAAAGNIEGFLSGMRSHRSPSHSIYGM